MLDTSAAAPWHARYVSLFWYCRPRHLNKITSYVVQHSQRGCIRLYESLICRDLDLYLHSKEDEICFDFSSCRFVHWCHRIDRWISLNHLKLIANKTVHHTQLEAAAFQGKCDSIRLGGLDITFLQKVTCLGIILDIELSMVQDVRVVTSCSFYQLRQIQVTCAAFINSRLEWLDYCKSVLYGVGALHLWRLQSVKNGGCKGCCKKTKIRPKENRTQSPQHFEIICTGCL